jgi:hypothetical protein
LIKEGVSRKPNVDRKVIDTQFRESFPLVGAGILWRIKYHKNSKNQDKKCKIKLKKAKFDKFKKSPLIHV